MSKEQMPWLADEFDNQDVYYDVKDFGDDRYVYNLLRNIQLSKEASSVLNKAIGLTIESFKYCIVFNYEHSEYNINSWDAGWHQIKKMLEDAYFQHLFYFYYISKKLVAKICII